MTSDLEKLIEETRKKYAETPSVKSPALNNEWIYFTRDGFDHLIRKGRKKRKISDQKRRLRLFPFAVTVIKTETIVHEYTTTHIHNKIGKFWALKATIDKVKIKVVIRQLGNGVKHFFSVMTE